jgi:hypothetical protein
LVSVVSWLVFFLAKSAWNKGPIENRESIQTIAVYSLFSAVSFCWWFWRSSRFPCGLISILSF